MKVGRYWFAYSLDDPPVITAVFYDAADTPGRVQIAPPSIVPLND